MTSIRRVVLFVLVALVPMCDANAQAVRLDSTWSVAINGQQGRANGNGTALLPNVSAADAFGPGGPGTRPDFLSDDFLQLIGTKSLNGVTQYVFSERFQISRNTPYAIQNLTLTTTPPPSVVSMTVSSSNAVIQGIGVTRQLSTIALLNSGAFQDVTPRSAWTVYRTSNPAVATVGPDGLVTSTGLGDAVMTAVNDGVSGVYRIHVIPANDPLTTVEGYVMQESGAPAGGATVDIGSFSRTTTAQVNGFFRFTGVPALGGNFSVSARFTDPQNRVLFGSSPVLVPVPAGITDAGIITVSQASCSFDPNFGTRISLSDDDVRLIQFSSGFIFPYFGVQRTDVWICSNGNLQFGGTGDRTFSPSVPNGVVNGVPRISIAFFDLYPPVGGGVWYRQDADRFVVTWYQVSEYPGFGSNTMQLTLYSNGRIDFAYAGMTSNGNTGHQVPVAISPGGTPTVRFVDYSAQTPFSTVPSEAPIENFTPSNLLDLDRGCLSFVPNAAGGFDVTRQILPPSRLDGRIRGILLDNAGRPLAGRSVRVSSSLGASQTVQTDARGRFQAAGIAYPCGIDARLISPAGAIQADCCLLRLPWDNRELVLQPGTRPVKPW